MVGIDGFKLSGELVQLRFVSLAQSKDFEVAFFRDLAAKEVNIFFLSRVFVDGEIQTSCCVAPECQDQVKASAESERLLKDQIMFVPSVGLLSMYPHQFSLKILGKAMSALGKARLPIYGIASSISSITFITDYACLKEAKRTLSESLRSPS